MNIIEIATLLSIEASAIPGFTEADFSEMINKLEAEKAQNPRLTQESIGQFLNAIKNYPKPFQEVMGNRILVNFFAQKNYSKRQFLDEIPFQGYRETRIFIELFLASELNNFVYKKIEVNDFQELSLLAEVKNFFPEETKEKLLQESIKKLDKVVVVLKPNSNDFSEIYYLKNPDFFVFLNGLKNQMLEEKVKAAFTSVKNFYYQNKTSEFAKQVFTAMKNYIALDFSFSEHISQFKNEAEETTKPVASHKAKYIWVSVLLGLIALVRLGILLNDLSKEDSEVNEVDPIQYNTGPKKLDRYYTDMKYRIDSFQVFLVGYNPNEIRRLTPVNDIKTGQNPFETFYENPPIGESSNNIRIQNNSNYDMLLLENAVLYETIKIPRAAHFIKAGDYLYINFNNVEAKTVFNVYLGKKLATFQTESNHLFIRNGSIVEYRFSELAPNAKAILKEDYIFSDDVNLQYQNGELEVQFN